jgi:putative inorganic carbon (HCO3(-)) transporter
LTYGGMALIIALITASAAIHLPGKRTKWLMMPLTILNLAGLAVSFARSAILGMAAGIIMLILQIHKKMRHYILLFLVLGVVLTALLIPGLRERFGNAFSSGEHSESPRVRLWLTSVEIIRHHPWFGVGQSNFGVAFDKYHLPGYYVSTAHPHCDLLSIAVDGGLLALGLFAWVMVAFFVKAVRGYRMAGGNAARRMVTGGGIAVVASILLAGLFQNYLSDAEVAGAFWFVVGLAMSQSDPEEVAA